MLDIGSVITDRPTHTRESADRDTIVSILADIAGELPRLEGTQTVYLSDLATLAERPELGAFDVSGDGKAVTNAAQNARNWTAHAVKQNYPGFADGKFALAAFKVRENGQTVGAKFAITAVRVKARDEV